ncbi:endonuclease domain-containing protein [Pseudooceanicola sp.]|uniref:endonuclease domain-containing protein n=1 Tax=Pseudooceanicola sp. TaxID=1914328 RepID=UPI00262F141A|nr:endonuclease domain-containing protein [Pseudooceanicola sp.]MDF1855541.1 endonuclease domain-containing protein [Pseudooceanicola sp.]
MWQNHFQTARARQLRQEMTPAERLLWWHLRNRRLLGLKFRRQVPIGPYIADFYCAEQRLVIETDGGGHADSAADRARDAWMRAQGLTPLRVWNTDITGNLTGALTRIAEVAGRLT